MSAESELVLSELIEQFVQILDFAARRIQKNICLLQAICVFILQLKTICQVKYKEFCTGHRPDVAAPVVLQ